MNEGSKMDYSKSGGAKSGKNTPRHSEHNAKGSDKNPYFGKDAKERVPLLALARQARLLEHQKRFVRDASHQLRTPLAVLKTQVQSALRGDAPPAQAFSTLTTGTPPKPYGLKAIWPGIMCCRSIAFWLTVA